LDICLEHSREYAKWGQANKHFLIIITLINVLTLRLCGTPGIFE
jgi:hypothetical protein